ncbi:MAG TPA: hypothetical protein ENJ56_02420 [Anaerolineae bacterium]|nr:hypothetical protein [Anaerolineae bacterium]
MKRNIVLSGILAVVLSMLLLVACQKEPEPTATPKPAPTKESKPEPKPVQLSSDAGAAAKAVDLLGAWVSANAPEKDSFEYEGVDGKMYQGHFDEDILPLFTTNGVWFDNSPACSSCHFANSEESAHEMNLTTYAGILAGADVLEDPPGVSILGQATPGEGEFNWGEAKLRHRLRDNRMPPGFPFDRTEENRDGPTLTVNGTEVRAVDLLGAWVDAGVPESADFGDYKATFDQDVLPLFTETGIWFDGSPACASCHTGNTEASAHEMDLGNYAGILAGADVLEDPPGVSILGESKPGVGDYSWADSKLRSRLRNNRMPPGSPFDITEANRDGPFVLHGQPVEGIKDIASTFGTGECEVLAVNLLGDWIAAAAPNGDFDFSAEDNTPCSGNFEADILPLFTQSGAWFDNSLSCASCHNANSEASAHEMDLSNYAGILAGADVLEAPPGVSILGESAAGEGDFHWADSKLRARLRNNRMPPGVTFDITEENRDGPTLTINGTEVRAIDLLGDWVNAGVPETANFGEYDATFAENVLPLFTTGNAWFTGSLACASCHSGNNEFSAHEMNLGSYEGILAGADVLEDPPGVSILGESESGAADYDWDSSKLRARLRNNRMPPGFPFDITEANRDGRIILAGVVK